MTTYKIQITETRAKIIEIEANTPDEAIDIAENLYDAGDDDSDFEFQGAEFDRI